MMDPKPMFPDMYHPTRIQLTRDANGYAKYYTRTARPTRYYIIDFGISRKFKPSDTPFLADVILGGVKTVPEHQELRKPCNPFPTDVYCLGYTIKDCILEVRIPIFRFILAAGIDTMIEEVWERRFHSSISGGYDAD